MKRVHVESTNIESVGYDVGTNTLEIEFKSGGRVYQYFDVPDAVHRELMASSSPGTFFSATIKGHFRFARVS